MKPAKGRKFGKHAWLLLAFAFFAVSLHGQTDEPAPQVPPSVQLQLSTDAATQLEKSIAAHDYSGAEKLLLAEIDRDPQSPRAAHLLAYIGTVYFLNHDYLNAAVAWKKSEAIAPLDAKLRFSLAMAYIRMGHSDWARRVLAKLATEEKRNALYPYWLGRLDYDGHEYNGAIRYFQHAIELDAQMARAYDNLGLCYYYQNQNELAVSNFQKAIELDRSAPHPSPWPYLNLAIAQQFLDQPKEAETNLRQAISLDPQLAQAHFQLGTLIEDLGRLDEAVAELRLAASLDDHYAEPHMALARIYHKLGQEPAARNEVQIYLRLHPHSAH